MNLSIGTLTAAREGLDSRRADLAKELDELNRSIGEIDAAMDGRTMCLESPTPAVVPTRRRPAAVKAEAPAKKKRHMSPAARKRIAAAQKKRWAAVRANKEAEAAA